MKLLFILEYFPPYHGGVERLFDRLTASLAQRGHRITVLTADYSGRLPQTEHRHGVEIHRIRIRNRFLFTLAALPRAVRLARDAELVHTTSYNAGFPSFIAARLQRKKVVITFHEFWGQDWDRLPFLKPYERLPFRLYERTLSLLPFHAVVAVSEYTRQRLSEVAGMKNVQCIYNGLEAPPSRQWKPNASRSAAPRFLFVGRLGVSKGIDLLVEAACRFLQDHRGHFVFVVSRQPQHMLDFIRSRFAEAGRVRELSILHEVDDDTLQREMLRASAVVVPSYFEGFGFVAAEASSLGIPVIHSGRGALDEVVSGKVIRMQSYTPEALVEAFKDASEGRYTSVPGKQFPAEQTVESYLALYERLGEGLN